MQQDQRALVLIDMQKGFWDTHYWGNRNNPYLEKNIERLLVAARESKTPVIHVQHISTEPQSPLNPSRVGVAFMDCALPEKQEPVFTKNVNSAFIGTQLETFLREHRYNDLIFAGLTSDHCVSTSSRMAANLGFKVCLASDATATFDRVGFDGEIFPADLVHRVSLASLNKEFATIMSSNQIIKSFFLRG